jgi:hypothetical protein
LALPGAAKLKGVDANIQQQDFADNNYYEVWGIKKTPV